MCSSDLRGSIITQSYSGEGYFAADYEGTVITEFYTDSTNKSFYTDSTNKSNQTNLLTNPSNVLQTYEEATILVRLGAVARYPGYYETAEGFLSDLIYIEDQDFYQPFSYVIKVDKQLSEFKKAVLDILHPVGSKLFGELNHTTIIDISTDILDTLRYLTSHFQDELKSHDVSNSKDITKILSELVQQNELIAKALTKPLTDSVNIAPDTSRYNLTK